LVIVDLPANNGGQRFVFEKGVKNQLATAMQDDAPPAIPLTPAL
jgi:hypothetical protein